ncbi:single-stranded-DNA-specific exonuclease RecJ [Aureibacillus halotolerans]|uniref:Single-stranded-DNA-specific exonuclease RecJ n=1 Tax=Aureibacillus halotolerans TaxID=1508390 RepID=A0A4R6TWX0_9BACI|nr:single-stranded-DNA-specific exonuclease RecJ [Aureibacillus halotolerans]TDQ37991.1 exonuclease RecJ [Aureibacillus halotolerans]
MLKSKKRWRINALEQEDEQLASFAKALKVSPLVAAILVDRGINTEEHAKAFLTPEKQSYHDPFLFNDMAKAVTRIQHAIDANEAIRIYGDYDADGVTSTAIVYKALTLLGASVDFYIPNRFIEGYGPNKEAFRRTAEEGISLLITVDNGISGVEEMAYAQSLGMDVIITDHHEAGEQLPDTVALIHPGIKGEAYPFGELAGAGVALKLAHALLGEVPDDLVALAAIGTIADLVPLANENRIIVAKGLSKLQQTTSPGLTALTDVCGFSISDIDEEKVGFAIGPRLNAVGRLGDATPAVSLLITDAKEDAQELALSIDQKNKERQQLVRKMTTEAIDMVESRDELPAALVLLKEDWNPGVVGIVASRMVDRFHRPCVVLGKDEATQMAKGSARSIEGFHLFDQLSKHRDILPHFGGHSMAAGMSLELHDVEELEHRLGQLVEAQLSAEERQPVLPVQMEAKLSDVTLDVLQQLQKLRPFGNGNPKPLFLFDQLHILQSKRIGSDKNHLKLTLGSEGSQLDAVGFQMGDCAEAISAIAKVSAVGELSINEWNGRQSPQLMLQDIAVKHWQLFDWRGLAMEAVKKRLQTLGGAKLFSFQNNTELVKQLESSAGQQSSTSNTWVLLDVPASLEELRDWLITHQPDALYIWFKQERELFDAVPSRERFKWVYQIVLTHQPVPLEKLIRAGKTKGLTAEATTVIVDVFEELGLFAASNDVLEVTKSQEKKDINESAKLQAYKTLLETGEWLSTAGMDELWLWGNDILENNQRVEEVSI